MAIFYVRKSGSDAAAGTSAGAAWATLTKALGATGIGSGDTLYVGAGIYRELITIGFTPAAMTYIIADVDGSKTGDAGEVQWTQFTTNDYTARSGTAVITLNSKHFLTFDGFVILGNVSGATGNSHDITFKRCLFVESNITMTTAANVLHNWLIDSCYFIKGSAICFSIILTRPATADFDYNIIFKNNFVIGNSISSSIYFITVTSTGANTFNGGGVIIYNHTQLSLQLVSTGDANLSTTIPCVRVYNCFHYGPNSNNQLSANVAGQIVEDYNVLFSGTNTNVTTGSHTFKSASPGAMALNFYCGHEYLTGGMLKPFGMPKPGSPMIGWGNQASSPTVDILGVAKNIGIVFKAKGTATAGAAKTITDSGANFGVGGALNGCSIKILSGTGSGQVKQIASHTATVITVDGNWKTNPDNTSVYYIYSGAPATTGKATAGAATSLTDSNAAWGASQWIGYTLEIDGGTGSGQTKVITANTATALTVSTWGTNPDSTSTYKIYRGASENVINPSVGCYERGPFAMKETTTVRTGSNAIRIPGAGYYDLIVPVDASSTTIDVYTQWDSVYSGTKPSMTVLNCEECGVTSATATATGSSGSWEKLSLNFTPTSKGIVTIRVVNSSTTPTGNAYFDDFAVS